MRVFAVLVIVSIYSIVGLAESPAATAKTPAPAVPLPVVTSTVVGTPNPPHTISFHSKLLGETRRVYVQLPHDYGRSNQRYPVLVVLDGEWLFELARAHARYYADYEAAQPTIPPMIVVGLENVHRDRDYTPTPDSGKEYVFDGAGGAGRFLDFLETELLPLLDARYRTASSRTLVGWSFGGLFTIHAAIERPALFDAYLAIGPAVWWDGEREVARFHSMKVESPKRMVVTLGSGEKGGWVHDASTRLIEAVASKPIPGLHFESLEIEGTGHTWSVSAAIDKGLRRLHDGYLPPDDTALPDLAAVDSYYELLSERWDYPVAAPYTVLQNLVLSGWKERDPEVTVALLDEIVRRYPVEPGAHYFLGRALKKAGRPEEGITAVEKALGLETSRAQPRHLKVLRFREVLGEERAAAENADSTRP